MAAVFLENNKKTVCAKLLNTDWFVFIFFPSEVQQKGHKYFPKKLTKFAMFYYLRNEIRIIYSSKCDFNKIKFNLISYPISPKSEMMVWDTSRYSKFVHFDNILKSYKT